VKGIKKRIAEAKKSLHLGLHFKNNDMKNTILGLLLATAGCFAQNDIKFSGKIDKPNSDKITLSHGTFKQVIPVAKDGSFSATFSAPEAIYQFNDGKEYTDIYLKPGYDLTMATDSDMFDEHLTYKGKGAAENNILAKKALDEEALEAKLQAMQAKGNMDQMAFTKEIMTFNAKLKGAMGAAGIDPGLQKSFEAQQKEQQEAQQQQMAEMRKVKEASAKMNGTASPTFSYENHKGGKTSLADFKGKYVYIDNWATWCGPCRGEIPYLQTVEDKYKGKNIEFVSISVDVKKDHDKWKKFVDDKKLGGTQLIADNDWNSDFMRAYNINSIPRFILIGPDGKIIDADAKRPSDPALAVQLDELLK